MLFHMYSQFCEQEIEATLLQSIKVSQIRLGEDLSLLEMVFS